MELIEGDKMESDLRQKLQFDSEETGVSITLPVGWLKDNKSKDEEYPSDVYVVTLGAKYSPTITIKIIELPAEELSDSSYLQLSEVVLLEQSKNSCSNLEVIDQRLETIDSRSARIDILNYIEKETKIPATQYLATVQLDTAVCGLIAIMKQEDKDDYLPVIDEAVKSMKFH